jgi:hypothetical protein
MLDGEDSHATSGLLEAELGRLAVPQFSAAVKADDEGGGGGLEEGEAEVAAIHGSGGAGPAQVGGDGNLPLNDLAADDASILRYCTMLASKQVGSPFFALVNQRELSDHESLPSYVRRMRATTRPWI